MLESIKFHGSDAVSVIFQTSEGDVSKLLLSRSDEPKLEILRDDDGYPFDADGNLFKLAAEALRIRLAFLFDPLLAVNTSDVQPLPHQITAVYESMLSRQPLRFLLADDPGAGKTIMAGLLIKELMLRGDVERCLIVVPGNLAEQWQDELRQKFSLVFEIMTNDKLAAAATGNWLGETNLVIARLDKLSRDETLHPKIDALQWDLTIFDEAHKLSASRVGGEVNYTKRYRLAQRVSRTTRHLLLLTATPHNGNDEAFELFMALLDGDRFEGKPRDGAHAIDVADMMRRLIKEQLVRFDGSPLFPARKAYTVKYELSDAEAALYGEVTDYVRTEFNRAAKLESARKGNVGFALTILQRRLASSPAAIYSSLERRRKRLEAELSERELIRKGKRAKAQDPVRRWLSEEELEDLDDAPDAELEDIEEELLLRASAAETIEELRKEIETLRRLEAMAKDVVRSGEDTKWRELSSLLQENKLMVDSHGAHRKLVIFTEHKDTLNYLTAKIRTLLGGDEAVVTISGGMGREERRKAEARFKQERDVRILVATDAAGEGINLQRAHLMVNYDLPWNPNRLEQRFGRIHRIGQTEVCHLWNMVAHETREGRVYERLLEKLAAEGEALQGRVFDVLGQVFEGTSLKKLLLDAVLAQDDAVIEDQLLTAVDELLDRERLEALLSQKALVGDTLESDKVREIRDIMDRALVRKLQPGFIRSFFEEAFSQLGGQMSRREQGRYQISHVPKSIRDRDRIIGSGAPVLKSYERITFHRELIEVPGKPVADLVTPGHPLLVSIIDLTLEQHRGLLQRGALLIDDTEDARTDESVSPRAPFAMVLLEHSIREGQKDRHGRPLVASRRMQFVAVDQDGSMRSAGYAPYLNYRPADPEEIELLSTVEISSIIPGKLESLAVSHAADTLVPEHIAEVQTRRNALVEKAKREVSARLLKEIAYWDHRAEDLRLQEQAGKINARLNSQQCAIRAKELRERLEARTNELDMQLQLQVQLPHVSGVALVLPRSYLSALRRSREPEDLDWTAAEVARTVVEEAAMGAVMAAERKEGRTPVDVSAQNKGWDIESRGAPEEPLRFIEVKGRSKGQTTITVSKNEILQARNNPKQFYLALVFVSQIDGQIDTEGPYYIRQPFDQDPGWAVSSVNFEVSGLLSGSAT